MSLYSEYNWGMGIGKNIMRRSDRVGIAALAIVYVVWGSTYLAIKVAVRGDGALPPFLLAAVRMGVASAILYAIAAARGDTLRLGARGASRAAAAGLLLWLGGNGLVVVGLTRVDSGLAAVLMATTPVWLAIIVAVRNLRLPEVKSIVGIALGLGGVAVLSGSGSFAGSGVGVALILLAAFSWALGSTLPSPGGSAVVNAAAIMWFAAIGLGVASIATGEPLTAPGATAVLGLGYLILVGSVVGFVSYAVALERLPLPLVMTHAQVNPLVAVGLGACFAGEHIGPLTAVAGVLIALSIPLARES